MLDDIVEVLEGGQHWANWYLAQGYRLLDIQAATRASVYPQWATNAGQAYVRRNPIYVVGRPRDVPWVEGPPARPRPPRPDETQQGDTTPQGTDP